MAATGRHRGHDIRFDPVAGLWRYEDDGVAVPDDPNRQCGACTYPSTPEGHDGCLGTLPGVKNACCGHGYAKEAYVQLADGTRLGGPGALRYVIRLKQGLPW